MKTKIERSGTEYFLQPIDPSSTDSAHKTIKIRIQPPSGWQALDLREIWRYRELLYFLAWRDVKVRYKQTAIGVAWAVLQPFLTMVVFSVIFGGLINVPTGGTSYPVFSYTALLPWTFFAAALSRASNSLVYDANLISKVYFPRLILPFAAVLSLLVDFGVNLIILLALMVVLGIAPGMAVFTLPFYLLIAFVTALGVGLWLSALNVKYRDIGYVIPFLTQFWLFLSPVAYPSSLIPERWQLFYSLNPLVGVIEGFRWALLGEQHLPGNIILFSILVAITLFVSGFFYFRRMEYEFADVV